LTDRSYVRLLGAIAVAALVVFAATTAVVAANPALGLDARAFRIADELRAPWLDHAARLITNLGLIAIVGPALVLGAVVLIWRRARPRAAALLIGGALAWVSFWITKVAVDRPRPPAPLVQTTGQSYPSGHTANSVGWLALAIALVVVIPTRAGRIAAIAAGALLNALVALSRIYLRAHYASDVIGGEALSVMMYAVAALAVLVRHRSGPASRWASRGAAPEVNPDAPT
jgi:membrane-associated phospholipid phosphatase